MSALDYADLLGSRVVCDCGSRNFLANTETFVMQTPRGREGAVTCAIIECAECNGEGIWIDYVDITFPRKLSR